MKKILIATMALLALGFQAQAYEMGLTGGMVTTELEPAQTGMTELDGKAGLYFGILGFIEMDSDQYFRSGAFYSNRAFDNVTAGVTTDVTVSSLDIPLTYMFMFNEYAGAYGGAKLSLVVSDDCKITGLAATCDADTESMFYAANVGGHFRFVPNFGIEVDYSLGLSDVAKDYKLKNSLAFGLFYLF